MMLAGSVDMHKVGFDLALTPHGWQRDLVVGIGADGRIASIEAGRPHGLSFVRGAALPGIANVHSHTFQRGMAGLAERAGESDDSFWTWRELMYRFLSKLTPDDIEAIAAQSFIEMLEMGFTSCGEFHYLHHDIGGAPYANIAETAERIAAASVEAGIGLVLLPSLYTNGNFAGQPASPGQIRFLNDLERFERLFAASETVIKRTPGASIGIAPHSLRAVSLKDLKSVVAMHRNGPVHIHVSEQVKELDDCRKAHGTTPIRLLADTVDLNRRWCLIHATHATPEERAAMAGAGATIGFCPITEANLGDGIFPVGDWISRAGRMGIGTDSNVDISMPGELRTLETVQRLTMRRRNVLAARGASTGRTLFDAAFEGGNQALGLGPSGIQVGARADIVVVDTSLDAFAGHQGDAILDALIFSAAPGAIRDVFVMGKHMVQAGHHIHRDLISARYRRTVEKLMAG
jgi:formimidoylglutamate deiminase